MCSVVGKCWGWLSHSSTSTLTCIVPPFGRLFSWVHFCYIPCNPPPRQSLPLPSPSNFSLQLLKFGIKNNFDPLNVSKKEKKRKELNERILGGRKLLFSLLINNSSKTIVQKNYWNCSCLEGAVWSYGFNVGERQKSTAWRRVWTCRGPWKSHCRGRRQLSSLSFFLTTPPKKIQHCGHLERRITTSLNAIFAGLGMLDLRGYIFGWLPTICLLFCCKRANNKQKLTLRSVRCCSGGVRNTRCARNAGLNTKPFTKWDIFEGFSIKFKGNLKGKQPLSQAFKTEIKDDAVQSRCARSAHAVPWCVIFWGYNFFWVASGAHVFPLVFFF